MKGTEKIIAHIQADAKAQADAILAQAEQQCAEIRRDYEIKAKDAYAEKIRLGVKSNQDKLDSVERLTRMESRKAILALKQEMVSAGFDKAVEELIALPQEKYIALLAKLASQASSTGDEEIVLNARDKAEIGAAVVKAANALLPGGKLGELVSLGLCALAGVAVYFLLALVFGLQEAKLSVNLLKQLRKRG